MEPVSRDQLAEWVENARARWNIPGLVVGVRTDGERLVAAAGVRELGREEPVTPETIFRVASITKPFVATLALALVQDGLLALDDPPPGTRVPATVRQLLSHQGGLAHEWPTPLDQIGEDGDALLRLAAGTPEPLPVGPGELFSYCNAGFWLVGAAAARVSGSSFEAAMSSRVLEPLGLATTSFDAAAGRAVGHNQLEPGADEHRPVADRYPRVRRPSGGLWSSVDDLLRFADHHLGAPGPLTRGSIVEMQQPFARGPSFDYGLGWFLTGTRGRRAVGHPGSAAGYQSQLLLFPDDGIAVAGLANSSRGRVAIEDVLQELGLGMRDAADVALSPAELARFEGRYGGQGVELAFARRDRMLLVEMREHDPFSGEWLTLPPVRARPIGAREFEIVDGEWRGERFDFPRDDFVCMSTIATRLE
jgi:CubicO group peptidase (beta-lactamase class C family)